MLFVYQSIQNVTLNCADDKCVCVKGMLLMLPCSHCPCKFAGIYQLKCIIICPRTELARWTPTSNDRKIKIMCILGEANESLMGNKSGLGCHSVSCEFMDAQFGTGAAGIISHTIATTIASSRILDIIKL